MSGGITPNLGLSVTDVVNVTTSLTSVGAALRNFGAVMLIGDTTGAALSIATRIRQYSTLSEVAVDFPANSPELLAATEFFGQSPQPSLLYVGFWSEATETLTEAVTALAAYSSSWYIGLVVAPLPATQADSIGAAQFVQGANPTRLLAFSSSDPAAPSSAMTDLAGALSTLSLSRTLLTYSGSNPYSSAPPMALASTVDFSGSNTALTLMFKTFSGVTADTLTETQADYLKTKNCNMYVNYNNGTAIYQPGVMSSGAFFDIMQGADALANGVTTNLFNLLGGAPKIPQTNGGVNLLVGGMTSVLEQYVQNGYLAPGVWNGASFGALKTGQYLASGYYIFAPSINAQAEASRIARVAPPFQIAVKLAGAIQNASCLITINQ